MKYAFLDEDDIQALVRKSVLETLAEVDFDVIDHCYKKEILTPADVATLLDTTESALASNRSHKKGIPYYKNGKRIYYRYSEIIEYLESNRVKVH